MLIGFILRLCLIIMWKFLKVLKDLNNLSLHKATDIQLIQDEIEKLEKRIDLVIRPADKGGAVVVMESIIIPI